MLTSTARPLSEPVAAPAPAAAAPSPARTTPVARRQRRTVAVLAAAAVAAAVPALALPSAAAAGIAAAALVLLAVYAAAVVRLRRVMVAREMAQAFGPASELGRWDRYRVDPVFAEVGDAGADGSAPDSPATVAVFVAASALAWLVAPTLALVRLCRGEPVTVANGGVLGGLARAQDYARAHTLRAAMCATAGVAAVSAVAPAAASAAGLGGGGPQGAHATLTDSTGGPTTSSYTVRQGDTLSEIALQYGTSVSAIAGANGIADPDQITTGAVLAVPVPSYTVHQGDTLSALGVRFGRSVGSLATANSIADPDHIVAGESLDVAGGTLPAAPQPAPAPAAAPAVTTTAAVTSAPPLVGAGTYTVQAGDQLGSIAAKFDTWTASLVAANHLTDADAIEVGQVLQVGGQGANAAPAPAAAPAVTTTAAVTSAPPLVGAGTYTVQAGDQLGSIAAKFDTWTASLVAANHLTDADAIEVGQVLQVGGQGANAAPAPAPAPATPAPAPAAPAPTPAPTPAATAPAPAPAAAPTPAASNSVTPTSSLEACIINAESGGDPQARNGDYWGLYQFSEGTWVEYGGSASAFGNAPASVQQQVFHNAIADGGASNWTPYDGC